MIMRMGTLLNNGCAALFHLFLGDREEVVPPRYVWSDDNSSSSEQEFPKIGQRMTAQSDMASGQLGLGPQRGCSLPADLEQAASPLWGSLYDSIKSLQSGGGQEDKHK